MGQRGGKCMRLKRVAKTESGKLGGEQRGWGERRSASSWRHRNPNLSTQKESLKSCKTVQPCKEKEGLLAILLPALLPSPGH